MKQAKTLYAVFKPGSYTLSLDSTRQVGHLEVLGYKVGRPSRRISLHQRKLKITKAEIASKGRKPSIVEVDRINHLPTFEQVRLHTKQMLYPGTYQIILEYKLPEAAQEGQLRKNPDRNLVPSIDEPEAWAEAKFEIKS